MSETAMDRGDGYGGSGTPEIPAVVVPATGDETLGYCSPDLGQTISIFGG